MEHGEAFPCRACGGPTFVLDSRPAGLKDFGRVIRRRRECKKCKRRATTYEIPAEAIDGTKRYSTVIARVTQLRDQLNRLLKEATEGS